MPVQLAGVHLIRRPPHGGRGLKSLVPDQEAVLAVSPPTRGAWIEMSFVMPGADISTVAPHTGGVD